MIRKYLLLTTGIVLAVFLLTIIASWVWLATLDLQAQRARIETMASQALAREVHIDGPLKLRASLFPSVSIENVRIANPEWAAKPDFLAVRQLEVEVNPWALLSKKFEIRDIELTGVKLYLQRGSDLDATWKFNLGTKQGSSPGVIPDIVALHARDVLITYHPSDRPPLNISIDELQASLVHDEPVTINLNGKVRNFPLSIDLQGDNFADLLIPGKRWPFKGTLGTDIQDLDFEGYVSDTPELNGVELKLSSDLQKQRSPLFFGKRITPLLDRYRLDLTIHREAGIFIAKLSSEMHGFDSSRLYEEGQRQHKPALKIREIKIDAQSTGKRLGQLIQSVAFELTASGIKYQQPANGPDQRFYSADFDSLSAISRDGTGFEVLAKGTANDKPVQLRASSKDVLFALWRRLDIPLAMDVQAGASSAHFAGQMTKRPAGYSLDGAATVKSDNLAAIGDLIGKKFPGSAALVATSPISFADRTLTLSDIRCQLGSQTVDGTFTLGFGNGIDISLKAHTDHFDIHDAMQLGRVPDNLIFGLGDLNLNILGKGDTFSKSLLGSDLQFTAGSGRLGWKSGRGKGAYLSSLQDIRFSLRDPKPVTLAAQVVYDKIPFKLDVQAGRLDELLDKARPYPLKLHLRAKGLSGSFQGTVQKPLADSSIAADVEAEGMLPVIGQLIGVKLDRKQSADLHGHLAATRGDLKLTGVVAKTDGIVVNGELAYQPADSPKLTVRMSDSSIDLAPYLKRNARPEQKPATTRAPDARIVPDIALDFVKQRSLDAVVTIDDLSIKNKDTPLTQINARFTANKGVFRLDPLETRSAINNSTILTKIEIDSSIVPTTGKLEFQASNFDFGETVKRLGITEEVTGTLNLQVDANGKGRNLREMIGSANGKVQLVADKGSIPKWVLEIWGGGLLRLIIPTTWAEDPKTDLNCAVARFDMKDGVMRSNTLLADTKRVTVAGEAIVNWQNEEINGIFKPQPKDPTLFHLGTPIQLSGTLAHPKVGSAQSGIVSLGKWAIGLTSPAALIVVFGDVGAKEKNPCAALLKEPAQK